MGTQALGSEHRAPRVASAATLLLHALRVLAAALALVAPAPAAAQPGAEPPSRALPRPSPEGAAPAREPAPGRDERGLVVVPAGAEPAVSAVKRRRALVIGNAAYPSAALRNPRNDAQDMAARLEQLQWSVSLVLDGGEDRMRDALTELGRQLQGGDDALVYYSGHGVHVDGVNYLVPIDTPFGTRLDIKNHALSLDRVLDTLTERDGGVNLVILDACRDNPLPASERNVARGLVGVGAQRASNTLIAYATKPNGVSSDGSGRNGTYTSHLLRLIGLDAPVYEMLMHVRNAVLEETQNRQEPWDEGSLREAFRIVPHDEPLSVRQTSSGRFEIRERALSLRHSVSTSVSPGEVRALALLSYHKSRRDWPGGLDRSLARLEEAAALERELDRALEELGGEPACAADRQRLSRSRLAVLDHRANLNPEAMLAVLEPALARSRQEGCEPRRFPWRDVTLAAIGSAVLGSAIAGTVYYTRARASWDEAQQSCPGGACLGEANDGPQQSREAKADADRASLWYSLGAAALTGMALTYFLWPDARQEVPSERAALPRVELGLAPRGPWASATLSF